MGKESAVRTGLTKEQITAARRLVLDGLFELFESERARAKRLNEGEAFDVELSTLGVVVRMVFQPDEVRLALGKLALRGK